MSSRESHSCINSRLTRWLTYPRCMKHNWSPQDLTIKSVKLLNVIDSCMFKRSVSTSIVLTFPLSVVSIIILRRFVYKNKFDILNWIRFRGPVHFFSVKDTYSVVHSLTRRSLVNFTLRPSFEAHIAQNKVIYLVDEFRSSKEHKRPLNKWWHDCRFIFIFENMCRQDVDKYRSTVFVI